MADQNLPVNPLYVTDDLVNLYGTTIDQILRDMGRNITLYLPPSESGCPSCVPGFDGSSQGTAQSPNPYPLGSPFNKSFPDKGLCRVCNGTHKIFTPVTITYRVSIQRTPKDFEYTQYGIDFDPGNVVKTKAKLATFEDFRVAEKALIDGDLYERIRYPIRTGLRDLRYVQCFWMRLNK